MVVLVFANTGGAIGITLIARSEFMIAPSARLLKGAVFSRGAEMADGTPAFPASATLGTRAPCLHVGKKPAPSRNLKEGAANQPHGLTIGVAPTTEVEQHYQQVGIVNKSVAVDIHATALAANSKQNSE
mgnify:CR=1 FL=1